MLALQSCIGLQVRSAKWSFTAKSHAIWEQVYRVYGLGSHYTPTVSAKNIRKYCLFRHVSSETEDKNMLPNRWLCDQNNPQSLSASLPQVALVGHQNNTK